MKRFALIAVLFAWACSKSQPAPAKPDGLLPEGTRAPDFTVQDQNGNEVSLAALAGKPVVLYWYPKDETPG